MLISHPAGVAVAYPAGFERSGAADIENTVDVEGSAVLPDNGQRCLSSVGVLFQNNRYIDFQEYSLP